MKYRLYCGWILDVDAVSGDVIFDSDSGRLIPKALVFTSAFGSVFCTGMIILLSCVMLLMSDEKELFSRLALCALYAGIWGITVLLLAYVGWRFLNFKSRFSLYAFVLILHWISTLLISYRYLYEVLAILLGYR